MLPRGLIAPDCGRAALFVERTDFGLLLTTLAAARDSGRSAASCRVPACQATRSARREPTTFRPRPGQPARTFHNRL